MSELRHDPLTRRWVIISTDRSLRPDQYRDLRTPREAPSAVFCPFCPGHEGRTPPEIAAIRPDSSEPNASDWQVRVVPNKYPALAIEGGLERRGVGLYDRMRGVGAHEVVIETPKHGEALADLAPDRLEAVLHVYRDRLSDLMQDERFKYVLLFKNHGAAAGATVEHAHSQIIATPVTPRTVAIELDNARRHHQLKERCLFCDVVQQELDTGLRVITADEHFVTLAPYASRFPFETLVVPRRHSSAFEESTPEELKALASTLGELLRRLRAALDDPPYNFMLHTAPNTRVAPKRAHYWDTLRWDYHWHIELLPRLTQVAGFEWGSGFYINPTAPEEAAEALRRADAGRGVLS